MNGNRYPISPFWGFLNHLKQFLMKLKVLSGVRFLELLLGWWEWVGWSGLEVEKAGKGTMHPVGRAQPS